MPLYFNACSKYSNAILPQKNVKGRSEIALVSAFDHVVLLINQSSTKAPFMLRLQ